MTRETMPSSPPTVLVTNVDSPLGHSIVRNISYLQFRDDIGLCGLIRGENPFGGEHLCDAIVNIRRNWTLHDLVKVCESNRVELIIPTTEEEAVYLKEAQEILPFVLTSSPEVSKIFLDKAATASAFARAGVPFCPTVLPSEYPRNKDAIGAHIIVKPRRGEHSAGVVKNPPSIESFSDDQFVIQPLMTGVELTTAVYYRSTGVVHGVISFIRRFVPQGSVYEVTRSYDSRIANMAKQLGEELSITGSINIQSIVSGEEVLPFEVNGRISSSNVIRAAFGFNDVQWGIEEYLLAREPSAVDLRHGSAISTRVDVIYPDRKLSEIKIASRPIMR